MPRLNSGRRKFLAPAVRVILAPALVAACVSMVRAAAGASAAAATPLALPHASSPLAAAGACPTDLHEVARLGGGTGGMVIGGHRGFLAVGRDVRVIDLADLPVTPDPDGWEAPTLSVIRSSQPVSQVEVSADVLYVVVGGTELVAYAIHDPAAAEELGRWRSEQEIDRIVIKGTRVFVRSGYSLTVLDAADPHRIQALESIELRLLGGNRRGLFVRDDLLFIPGWDVADSGERLEGLQVFRLDEGGIPRRIGLADLGLEPESVAFDGDLVYLTASEPVLHVFAMGDPLAPTWLGSADVPGWSSYPRVVGADGHAYVGGSSRLHLIDVTVPTAPVVVETLDLPGGDSMLLDLEGSLLFAASDAAVHIFDVANPAEPAFVGAHHALGHSEGAAAVRGEQLLIGSGEGLRAVDISDPTNPQDIGGTLLPEAPTRIVVQDESAFVAGGWFIRSGTVSLVEFTQFGLPVRLSSYRTAGNPLSLAAAKEHVFVTSIVSDVVGNDAWENFRLEVFDFSAPGLPVAGPDLERPGALAIVDGHMFVFDGAALNVWDITVPMEPKQVSSQPFDAAVRSIVTRQNLLYAVGERMHVVDVQTPRNPVVIATSQWSAGYADGVALDGDCAFLAGSDRLTVVDIGDRRHPTMVGTYRPLDNPLIMGVAASAGRVYVSSRFNGLQVLEGDNPGPVDPVPADTLWFPALTTVGAPVHSGIGQYTSMRTPNGSSTHP